MSEHPIENLMVTAMNSIQDMIDVNTIIGEPIETSNNIIIIPISKVSFGFAAGGSEFKGETIDEYKKKEKEEQVQYRLPFGGGSGAGVSINPVAFLVVQSDTVKLLPIEHVSCIDRLLDYVPELIDKANNTINKCIQSKKEETDKIVNAIQKKKTKNDEKKKGEKEQRKSAMVKPVKAVKEEEYEFEYDETKDAPSEFDYSEDD